METPAFFFSSSPARIDEGSDASRGAVAGGDGPEIHARYLRPSGAAKRNPEPRLCPAARRWPQSPIRRTVRTPPPQPGLRVRPHRPGRTIRRRALFFSIIQRRPDFACGNNGRADWDARISPALKTRLHSLPVPSQGKGARPCELAAAGAVGAGLRSDRTGLGNGHEPFSRRRGSGRKGPGRRTPGVQGIGFRKHADLPAGGVRSGKALTGPLVLAVARKRRRPSASDQTRRAEPSAFAETSSSRT